jgi:hypothetical protein
VFGWVARGGGEGSWCEFGRVIWVQFLSGLTTVGIVPSFVLLPNRRACVLERVCVLRAGRPICSSPACWYGGGCAARAHS